MDDRHPSDTLFIIFEEDWRLFEEDQGPRQEERVAAFVENSLCHSPGASTDTVSERQKFDQALASDYKERFAGPVDETAPPIYPSHEGGKYLATSLTKPKGTGQTPAEPIKDIVRLCTYAHRKGLGDLVWLTWDGDTGQHCHKKPRPSHGSTAIAMTQQFGHWLEQHWHECIRSHFDLSLKWLLETYGGVETRASFVMRSIGHYASHDSGILEEERKAAWQQWWVHQGVRMCHSPAQKPRELWTWEKGKTCCVGEIPLENEEQACLLQWKTLFKMSANPSVKPEHSQSSSAVPLAAQGRPPQPQHLTQEQMQRAYDQSLMVGEEKPKTQRQERERRARLQSAGLRIFTQREDEVRIPIKNRISRCRSRISSTHVFCDSHPYLHLVQFFDGLECVCAIRLHRKTPIHMSISCSFHSQADTGAEHPTPLQPTESAAKLKRVMISRSPMMAPWAKPQVTRPAGQHRSPGGQHSSGVHAPPAKRPAKGSVALQLPQPIEEEPNSKGNAGKGWSSGGWGDAAKKSGKTSWQSQGGASSSSSQSWWGQGSSWGDSWWQGWSGR